MKTQIRALAIALGLFCAASGFAQTTAADAMKSANTAATTATTNAVNNAKTTAAATVATKVNPPAAGGGAGKVWVNSSSKTYHCEGSKFYGKTKTGEYMTEAEAKAKGNHAVKGKACAK